MYSCQPAKFKCKILGLCHKKIVCNFCQSVHTFSKYLTEKFWHCGPPQPPFHPYNFVDEKIITFLYIDDMASEARNEKEIFVVAFQLNLWDGGLEQEYNTTRFIVNWNNLKTGYWIP